MSNTRHALGLLVLVVAAFLGCSQKEENPAEQAAVRGEAIRRQPAAEKTASPLTTSNAVATGTNALKACDAPLPPRLGEKTEFVEVGFDKLSAYTFNVPEGVIASNQVGQSEAQIPPDVKAFDEKKVALKGFMLPLKVDNGLVTEMLIMKDQSMCCYGAIPRINDWVSVKMKNNGVKSVMDQAVTLYGKLRVGEMLENGYLVGVYEMDGEKMAEVKP